MGIVVEPDVAFKVCHGYKLSDDELILWSAGVIGALSDEQERLCEKIILNNVKGEDVFNSVKEALRAPIEWRDENLKSDHFKAMKVCSRILHEADMFDMVIDPNDVYGLMDYCLAKLGFGKDYVRPVSEDIKEYVDMRLKEYEDQRS